MPWSNSSKSSSPILNSTAQALHKNSMQTIKSTIPIHNKYQRSLKSSQNSTICEESSVFVDEDTNSEIDQQVIASTSTAKIQQPTPTISKRKTCATTRTRTIKKPKLADLASNALDSHHEEDDDN